MGGLPSVSLGSHFHATSLTGHPHTHEIKNPIPHQPTDLPLKHLKSRPLPSSKPFRTSTPRLRPIWVWPSQHQFTKPHGIAVGIAGRQQQTSHKASSHCRLIACQGRAWCG
eukprot:GHUV01032697.1.p1 GENE.GHUV01032697.1~~GHUV01032697.1.p1  ORF type:complete len:111 (+),score=2.44 GHUV01032697.1:461-793(+)